MTKHDYYTLKQIVFGLRDKYMMIENELKHLDKYFETELKTDKLTFQVLKSYNNRTSQVRVDLLRQQSKLVEILEMIGKSVSKSNYESKIEVHKLLNSNSHELLIGDTRKISIAGSPNELYRDVDVILTDPFIMQSPTRTTTSRYVTQSTEALVDLNILSNNIVAYGSEKTDSKLVPSEFMSYSPSNDSIIYNAYRDMALNVGIYQFLDTTFEASKFTEEQRECIESSLAFIKPIEVIGYSPLCDSNTFKIEEDEHKIMLIKK